MLGRKTVVHGIRKMGVGEEVGVDASGRVCPFVYWAGLRKPIAPIHAPQRSNHKPAGVFFRDMP